MDNVVINEISVHLFSLDLPQRRYLWVIYAFDTEMVSVMSSTAVDECGLHAHRQMQSVCTILRFSLYCLVDTVKALVI